MKKETLSVIMFLVAFVSCRKHEAYHMSRQKLRDVVKDMYLVDINVNGHPKEYRDSISSAYMEQIAKIHQVSQRDIDHDIELLKNDFSLLDSLYSEILTETEAELKLKPKGKRDQVVKPRGK